MATEHTFNIPFGTITRPADGAEMPAIHWVDISEKPDLHSAGMTLLNDAKYGHSIQGNTMAMSLIRSSYEPDNIPDVGHHEFTYSIYPHSGGWMSANSERRGWEFNQPLVAATINSPSDLTEEHERLASFSALRIEEHTPQGWKPAQGTPITAFKPSSTGSEKLIRLAQMHEGTARLRIVLPVPVLFAEETDLLEQPIRTLASGNRRLWKSVR